MKFLKNSLSNEQGISMMEVLMAMILLTTGILAYGRFTAGVVDRSAINQKTTIATTLAEDKLEDLRNLARAGLIDSSDNGTDTVDSEFNRTWTIAATAITNVSQLTVTVAWQGSSAQSVSLTTLLDQSAFAP